MKSENTRDESFLWNFLDQKKVPWKTPIQALKEKYGVKNGKITVSNAENFLPGIPGKTYFEYVYGILQETLPSIMWSHFAVPVEGSFDYTQCLRDLEAVFGPSVDTSDQEHFGAKWVFGLASVELSYTSREMRASYVSYSGSPGIGLDIRTGYRPMLSAKERNFGKLWMIEKRNIAA